MGEEGEELSSECLVKEETEVTVVGGCGTEVGKVRVEGEVSGRDERCGSQAETQEKLRCGSQAKTERKLRQARKEREARQLKPVQGEKGDNQEGDRSTCFETVRDAMVGGCAGQGRKGRRVKPIFARCSHGDERG